MKQILILFMALSCGVLMAGCNDYEIIPPPPGATFTTAGKVLAIKINKKTGDVWVITEFGSEWKVAK